MNPQRPVPLPVRLVWAALALVALWYLGVGLEKNFYFEPTGDALAEAKVGTRMVAASTAALVVLAAVAWWASAPRWATMLLLVPAVACGGLLLVWPAQLIGGLVFFVAGPVAGLAALVAAAFGWPTRREPELSEPSGSAPRPAR